MFGRRVAASCGIPPSMYTRLHIHSVQQANHMLPPLMLTTSLISRSVSGGTGVLSAAVGGGDLVPADLSAPPNLLAALGVTPQMLLSAVKMSPILRMISDTMCTYSVILPHAAW